MKAWFVCDDDDIGILVHAETRGKAKVIGGAEMSFDPLDYIYIHAKRIPKLDNKPFTVENVNAAQVYTGWNEGDGYESEDGFFIRESEWYNNCRCEVCKEAKQS